MFPIRDEEKEEYYDKYVKLFNKMRKKVNVENEIRYQLDKEKTFKEALEILKKIPSKELKGENNKPLLDKMRKYVMVSGDVLKRLQKELPNYGKIIPLFEMQLKTLSKVN